MAPIYTWKCKACEKTQEKIQTISEGEAYEKEYFCPECGGTVGFRVMGKTSFSLQGGGWYAQGYDK